jgi:hypothetical protein
MIWCKRSFAYAEYAPYAKKLEELMLKFPTQYREFIMVSTKTQEPGFNDYYVGLPSAPLLALFDGFATIPEELLPKEIDSLEIADGTSEEFTSRFKFREGGRR